MVDDHKLLEEGPKDGERKIHRLGEVGRRVRGCDWEEEDTGKADSIEGRERSMAALDLGEVDN